MLCDSSTSAVAYDFIVRSADGSCRILSLGGEESQRTEEDAGAFFICVDTLKSPLLTSEHLSPCLTAARGDIPLSGDIWWPSGVTDDDSPLHER